jgi:hypothetical protein
VIFEWINGTHTLLSGASARVRRRRGTQTLRHLSEDGYAHVHLWTSRDTPQSRRFYLKSGFTESGAVGTHDFGDGNPLEQVEYERAC